MAFSSAFSKLVPAAFDDFRATGVCTIDLASHLRTMPLATTATTFGDLARDGLAVEVTCPQCDHRKTIDGDAPALRGRRIAGARFRCERCGSVGLPSLGRPRLLSTRRLAKHAGKLGGKTSRESGEGA
jgi:hypothetical protein